MELIRPMLAAPTKDEDIAYLPWPMMGSPKLDGIRALCRISPVTGDPELVSRKLLPIPNVELQRRYARPEYVGLDGELIYGEPTDKQAYNKSNSAVMSEDGPADVGWHIFDKWNVPGVYVARATEAKAVCRASRDALLNMVPQVYTLTPDHMRQLEEAYLTEGYEGMILRHIRAPYKMGRSTLKQGWMVKIKRFMDSEAVVTGVVEQMANTNELQTDETGYAKRSHAKDGKVGKGRLGVLVGFDKKHGWEVEVSNFTDVQRVNLWEGQQYLPGKIFTYKYFPIGIKDGPRHPQFKGWRDRRDA